MAEVRAELDFEKFFRAHYRRLAQAVYLLTGNKEEAEDLAQEALARAYERWDRVGGMACPEGYVYRTALNLQRKQVRGLTVRRRRLASLIDAANPGPDPQHIAEIRSEIHRILASLPVSQREALILVEWLGLTADEAGQVLGVEAASVRGRLHRARQAVRNRVGGADD